jgi:predicted HicB family RNase H-like nuclease
MTWVNLDLPEAVHEAAKKKAIDAKKTLREYLIEVITKGVL